MESSSILQQNIYLIGDVYPQIITDTLPSKLQVLKVFFYHLRVPKLKIRESAQICIDQVIVFWQKAQIPIQRIDHCIHHLLKLHKQYHLLQKSVNRDTNEIREVEFKISLLNLFDIAHLNVAQMVDESIMQFLNEQREDRGRVRCIPNTEFDIPNIEFDDDDEQVQKMKADLLQLQKKVGREVPRHGRPQSNLDFLTRKRKPGKKHNFIRKKMTNQHKRDPNQGLSKIYGKSKTTTEMELIGYPQIKQELDDYEITEICADKEEICLQQFLETEITIDEQIKQEPFDEHDVGFSTNQTQG
ncbi:uncharacterized protein LOC113363475 [Ctenocephalides felis]|uniref:uncharacterized protein LOC113363475 n=1 Tax=Ctenocephalides felis TaxID=7515 RepID=UPI000E6E2B5B|nr:uncharacterized protein LOC113363475 [Ctenocephalides felis]XP_026461763.1 uncharacterized protein LOC113363475 [Ctenocephalides felis]